MNIYKINAILAEFMSQTEEIEGVVLISSNGQLLTEPIGIDINTAMILGGIFLHLAQNTYQQLDTQEIESISLRSGEGNLIFTACYPEVFLLVKSSNSLSFGLLERRIHLAAKMLQEQLQTNADLPTVPLQEEPLPKPVVFPASSASNSTNIPKNNRGIKNTRIRYRGLPV
ncbi:roadblock/LC7 domain-containing protein [Gloeothece verrucosa]|uniref:Roadblock/LC7 family protein n=1 Tax=Gloeothece verrucosa (strain PCC 7822) TaxID=497965 RepID=E0UDA8_GLOV7|nr:Roadblock/LC7 family protein [Gloeothece verrucosa]ADN14099.1 Roadblock/LC7 family protein [Gloeothece verrucosa PCC 7822]